jgi:hypothetical protein
MGPSKAFYGDAPPEVIESLDYEEEKATGNDPIV